MDYEEKADNFSVDDHVEILEKSNIDQIDLVSEINRLDSKKENEPTQNENRSNAN